MIDFKVFIHSPPNIIPAECKPPKLCLQMSISPGVTFGNLRYVINLYIPENTLLVMLEKATIDSSNHFDTLSIHMSRSKYEIYTKYWFHDGPARENLV